eukprot:EW705918.1.p2 GENE.EW705918.1~~EW705918.1.p2  ORF type:complete len:95 (+),score=13.61 EW705918.1:219-503(+)
MSSAAQDQMQPLIPQSHPPRSAQYTQPNVQSNPRLFTAPPSSPPPLRTFACAADDPICSVHTASASLRRGVTYRFADSLSSPVSLVRLFFSSPH